MMRTLKLINALGFSSLSLSGILVSGCITVDVTDVEEIAPVGPPVNAALHSQYIDLAKQEAGRGSRLASSFFASKARLAARGDPVGPELPDEWDIPPAAAESLEIGRTRLIVALAETRRAAAPAEAARAQAMFDCWVVAAERKGNSADGTPCRLEFSAALQALQSSIDRSR